MSNIQTGAERMPHNLSHLGFLAGQIGRLITISMTPIIAADSFEMDAVGALRLSPLRRGLAIDSTFFSSRRWHTRCSRDWSSDVCFFDLRIRHTRCSRDWSSDVCSSDLDPRRTGNFLMAARRSELWSRLGARPDKSGLKFAGRVAQGQSK